MNILILSTHLNTGGITSYIVTLAGALKKRGHGVWVVTAGGNMVEALEGAGIEHVTIPFRTKSELSPKIYSALPALTCLIREKNIRIIHTHTRITQVLGTLLGKMTGARHVATCHGFFKKRLSRRVFPCWGQATVAISEPVREHLIRDFGLRPEKIFLVHNGLNLDAFPEVSDVEKAMRRKVFRLGDEPVAGIVARLSEVKGHATLLAAMKIVAQKIKDARLLVIGQGKMEEELKAMTKTLGLEAHVDFYPIVNETPSILSMLDVFVMPSLQEGLGLAVMEAQAMALPVIASRVGGIPSLIEDGKTGFLVSPGSAEQLARALVECFLNKEKAKIIGREARRFVRENFSAQKMAKETVKVYEHVLG